MYDCGYNYNATECSVMIREDDRAVLCMIGQLTLKTDENNIEQLNAILNGAKKNKLFLTSPYGKRYIAHMEARIRTLSGGDTAVLDAMIRRSDKKTEELFRDLDESLMDIASQRTARNTEKLVWVILALTILDTIAILFTALFVWNLNMG